MRIALALWFAASVAACVVGDGADSGDLVIADEGPDTDESALDQLEMEDATALGQADDALKLAAAVPLTPGCVAKGTLGGRTAWIHFTRPLNNPCVGNPGRDRNVLKELVRLIDS